MNNVIENEDDGATGRARGGKARAEKMTQEERKLSSAKAVAAKKMLANLPTVIAGSKDRPLLIGGVEIQCYVLSDGSRVLSAGGIGVGLGYKKANASDLLAKFVASDRISPFINKEIVDLVVNPIKFKNPAGGKPLIAYPATLLADICDAILIARREGALQAQQLHIAHQAEVLIRGFARVGIVALVDETTGYQSERERDELAKILEAFVAKELQPWLKTFPPSFYKELYRLRGTPYPPKAGEGRHPSYMGNLTNNIVYDRLAPGLRDALKSQAKKLKRKSTLHQHLTRTEGYVKLVSRLEATESIMKLSNDYEDFKAKLDIIYPIFPKIEQDIKPE